MIGATHIHPYVDPPDNVWSGLRRSGTNPFAVSFNGITLNIKGSSNAIIIGVEGTAEDRTTAWMFNQHYGSSIERRQGTGTIGIGKSITFDNNMYSTNLNQTEIILNDVTMGAWYLFSYYYYEGNGGAVCVRRLA